MPGKSWRGQDDALTSIRAMSSRFTPKNSEGRFSDPRPLRKRVTSASTGVESGPIDWAFWLRLIERKRRMMSRVVSSFDAINPAPMPAPDAPALRARREVQPLHSGRFFDASDVVNETYCSFRLDGWDVTPQQVSEALLQSVGRPRPELRSRQAQRLRNHASILHHIESSLRLGEPLKPHVVVRWFTTLSSGLSASGLDDAVLVRLDQVVRKINSPQLRLQPALQEITRLHAQLMSEPLMPGYNGIVCRLLLRYHLGRCNLPRVTFDPTLDATVLTEPESLLARLLRLIDQSYDRMLLRPRRQ